MVSLERKKNKISFACMLFFSYSKMTMFFVFFCDDIAKCCDIQSSKGRKSCNVRGSWGLSLDRRGWSVLDTNYFMIGLYRSGGQYLYNIEYPQQCTFYSYNL